MIMGDAPIPGQLLNQYRVTFGMVITGTLPKLRGALLLPPQMLGGMVAAAWCPACSRPYASRDHPPEWDFDRPGLFIEMFLTVELVITVLFLAAEKQKVDIHRTGCDWLVFIRCRTRRYAVILKPLHRLQY